MLLLQQPTAAEEAYGYIGLAFGLVAIVCWGFILHKLGYSGWFYVLFFIPFLNIGLMIYVALARSPVQKEVSALKKKIKELQIKVVVKEQDG